jgi:hypothetical protein
MVLVTSAPVGEIDGELVDDVVDDLRGKFNDIDGRMSVIVSGRGSAKVVEIGIQFGAGVRVPSFLSPEAAWSHVFGSSPLFGKAMDRLVLVLALREVCTMSPCVHLTVVANTNTPCHRLIGHPISRGLPVVDESMSPARLLQRRLGAFVDSLMGAAFDRALRWSIAEGDHLGVVDISHVPEVHPAYFAHSLSRAVGLVGLPTSPVWPGDFAAFPCWPVVDVHIQITGKAPALGAVVGCAVPSSSFPFTAMHDGAGVMAVVEVPVGSATLVRLHVCKKTCACPEVATDALSLMDSCRSFVPGVTS